MFSVLSVLSYAQMNAPYQDEALAKYCSDPNRLLVIETKQGTMKIQLFDKVAPNHVKQITALAAEGKYDGTTFHRLIKDFMIQGGDDNSKDDDLNNDGSGGFGNRLNQEFNEVSHKRGACSMARTNDPNSATSQFFICHGNPTFLDKQYTVWGQLISGYDVMDKIMNLKGLDTGNGVNPGKESAMIKVYVADGKSSSKKK